MALLQVLQDDFNDNVSSPNWTKEGTTSEVVEQNNRVEITHTAAAEYNTYATTLTYDLTSSYGLVRVLDVGNQTLASHEVILGVRKDSNNALWFTASNGNLSAYKKVGGVQTQVGASIPYSSTTHVWWRLRESGGNTFLETTADRINWTGRWGIANPFAMTAINAYLQSGCWQLEASGSYGYFDNFNVAPNYTKVPTVSNTVIYKVYDPNNNYLGVLDNVISEFTYSQNINSAGTQIAIKVQLNVDTAFLSTNAILDEQGNNITDENGNLITDQGVGNIVGDSDVSNLIQNGNQIQVWEYSNVYSGSNNQTICQFAGFMSKWKPNFKDNTVEVICISNGQDLSNFLIKGGTINQISQTTASNTQALTFRTPNGIWSLGQTFTAMANFTLSNVTLKFANTNSGDTNLGIVTMYYMPNGYPENFGMTILGSAYASSYTQNTTQSIYTFSFGDQNISMSNASNYLIVFTAASEDTANRNITFSTNNAAPYQPAYYRSAPGNWTATTYQLYFEVYSSSAATTLGLTATPSSMLSTIMTTYNSNGGLVQLNTPATVGSSTSYTFNTQTMLQGTEAILALAPADTYWYVDPAAIPGTKGMYFAEASSSADFTLIKGRHIQDIELEASKEQIYNSVYFVGGDNAGSPGSNVFVHVSNSDSVNNYRTQMYVLQDNHVTSTTVGTLIANNFMNDHIVEQYIATVYVLKRNITWTMNTAIRLGAMAGFSGWGNYIDFLLLQVVGYEPHSDYIKLSLGTLPLRTNQIIHGMQTQINNINSVANPSSPS